MLHSIDPILKNHSRKLDVAELRGLMLRKEVSSEKSEKLKFPSLVKHSHHKKQEENGILKLLLKRSSSLDSSEKQTKKLMNSLQIKKSTHIKKRQSLDENIIQKNKFDHYKSFLNTIDYEKKGCCIKVNKEKAEKKIQFRKNQMPYIRAVKKQYHKKNKSVKQRSNLQDHTFVRIRSPGVLRNKVQISRVLLNCSQNIETPKIQSKSIEFVEDKILVLSPNRKPSSQVCITVKKNKILPKYVNPQQFCCSRILTPWKGQQYQILKYLDQKMQEY